MFSSVPIERIIFFCEKCVFDFFFFCCCFFFFFLFFFRGKSGNLARLKMELFVTIVNNFQPLHVLQKELHLICGRVPKFTSVFFSFFCGRKTYQMFGNMPPWAIVTQNNKLFNSLSFRTASIHANYSTLTRRLLQSSCIIRINIIL